MNMIATVRFAALLAPAFVGLSAAIAAAEPSTPPSDQTICPGPAQSPRGAATGQASGKRQHQPISIVKQADRPQPLAPCTSSSPAEQTQGAPLKGVDVKIGKQ